jgi:hypothetical protein
VRKIAYVGALLCAMSGAGQMSFGVVPSILPMTTFGGGDGWLAPGDRGYLTSADNAQRGLAYNPVTGNLLVVNRSGTVSVNIIDGLTGGDEGALPLANFITGATFSTLPINMIAAGEDGTIYAANLSIGPNQQLRIYQWNSETSAPSMPFINDLSNGPRVGDTLDVRGPDGNARLLLGVGGGQANNGYVLISSLGGPPYGASPVVFNSVPPADGEHRLGITFTAGDTVLGTRGGLANFVDPQPARYSSFDSSGATLLESPHLTAPGERPMDFAEIDGLPVLATLDTDNSIVRIYDFTDPANPLLLDSHTNIIGPGNANNFGVGQIRFGAIAGNRATLYALNSNNGIQAFTVTVPEPAVCAMSVMSGFAIIARRRRHSCRSAVTGSSRAARRAG